MAMWQPDPSFYPSPRQAAKAPRETLAYVAAFDPARKTGDAIATKREEAQNIWCTSVRSSVIGVIAVSPTTA